MFIYWLHLSMNWYFFSFFFYFLSSLCRLYANNDYKAISNQALLTITLVRRRWWYSCNQKAKKKLLHWKLLKHNCNILITEIIFLWMTNFCTRIYLLEIKYCLIKLDDNNINVEHIHIYFLKFNNLFKKNYVLTFGE